MYNCNINCLREYLPLEQGLRPRYKCLQIRVSVSQRVSSIRTRIKTINTKVFRYLLCPFERYRSAAEFCRHMNRALKKISEMDAVEDKAGEIREKEYNPLFPD